MRYECVERIQAIVRDGIKQFFLEEQQFEVKFSLDAFIGITIDEMGMFYVTLKEVFDKEGLSKDAANVSATKKPRNMPEIRKKRRLTDSALPDDVVIIDTSLHASEASCDGVDDGQKKSVHHSLPLSWLKRDIESESEQGDSSFGASGEKPGTTDSYQGNASFSIDNYQEEDDGDMTSTSSTVPGDLEQSATAHFWFDSLSKPLEDLKKRPAIMIDEQGHCIHGECSGRKIKLIRSNFRRHWLEIHSPIVEARQCPIAKCNKWMLRDYNAHFMHVHSMSADETKNMNITDFTSRWFTRQAWDTLRSYRRHHRSGTGNKPYTEISDEQLLAELTSHSGHFAPAQCN